MVYSSWDIMCDTLKLLIMGHFCLFTGPPPSPTPRKNQNFETMYQKHVYQKP